MIIIILIFFFVVIIVEVVICVGEIQLINPYQNEILAALRTTQSVSFLEVLGVNLVVLALWAGRHMGSMRRNGPRRRLAKPGL